MYIIIFACLLAICNCQYKYSTEKPWPGPFANHKLGEEVTDTPEVVRAKNEHFKFFAETLKNLPVLPPEERYIAGPYEIAHHNEQQGQYHPHQEQAHYQFPVQPQQYDTHFKILTPPSFSKNYVLKPATYNVPHAQSAAYNVPAPHQYAGYVPVPSPQTVYQQQYVPEKNKPIYDYEEPLSEYGETQEVAKARAAHFESVAKAKAALAAAGAAV